MKINSFAALTSAVAGASVKPEDTNTEFQRGGSVLAAGAPATVLTPALLQRAYGVLARVERCSEGHLLVLADAALPQ